ncbi:cytochrome P450 [Archangium gephyra]|uniref:cytochrome P450 n=1 Tax=Archangium gephyra TaxID=48 RepID=UPI003B7C7A8A
MNHNDSAALKQQTPDVPPSLPPVDPPRVTGFPLVGALPSLLKDRLDFLEAARRRHGDVFTLDLGFTEAIIMCHPRHAQHILVDQLRNYAKGGPIWESLRTFLGNGLPVSEGEYWKRQRRMVQPAFHHKRLVTLTDKMTAAIDESLKEWEAAANAGEPFNVAPALSRLTINVLVRAMFGSGLSTSEAERVGQDAAYIIDYVMMGMMTNKLPEWMPVPGRARYRQALRSLDEIVFQVIERGRKGAEEEDNLLSLLLNMVDTESGERMTDTQLRDEAVALFVAGYETTAAGLTWALHFLTQHPETSQRMKDEVDEVLGQRTAVFTDLLKLSHTRNVFQESLRMYSPAYWLPRTAQEEDEIDGYRIPAGRMVVAFSHLIHRNPSVWEHPERFDPDRFTPARSEGRHKHAWIPFGAGQRLCIGKDFSLMEAQLILSRLTQRFQMSAVPGREPVLHLGTSMRTKDGVWVRLKAR